MKAARGLDKKVRNFGGRLLGLRDMKHGNFSKVSQCLPKVVFAACTAILLAAPSVLAETYQIDPVHSNVAFKVKHLFTFVNGRFDDVSGTITLDREKPENSTVAVKIEAKSINTANEKRDGHLRTADFFEVEKYPAITFQSKSVKLTGEKTADIVGDLTLHGITKEVTLKAQLLGEGPGMQGEKLTGWRAETALKRSDFGMTWGKIIEGTPLVGDDVEIILDVEAGAAKTEAAAQ